MNPTTSLARRDLKNEPCPQSWKMMKMRTRSAPAEDRQRNDPPRTPLGWNIRYQSRPYGPNVLTICHGARAVEGCWY